MSGSKEGVKARVIAQLDKTAEQYKATPEGADVVAAKDRILALIDACALGPDAHGTDWNAVKVAASGSHAWTDKGIQTASFKVEVTRLSLAL